MYGANALLAASGASLTRWRSFKAALAALLPGARKRAQKKARGSQTTSASLHTPTTKLSAGDRLAGGRKQRKPKASVRRGCFW
jgi:hypothetical protein